MKYCQYSPLFDRSKLSLSQPGGLSAGMTFPSRPMTFLTSSGVIPSLISCIARSSARSPRSSSCCSEATPQTRMASTPTIILIVFSLSLEFVYSNQFCVGSPMAKNRMLPIHFQHAEYAFSGNTGIVCTNRKSRAQHDGACRLRSSGHCVKTLTE